MQKISLFTEVRGLDLSFEIKELSYHPHAHFKFLMCFFKNSAANNFYLPENLYLLQLSLFL